MNIWGYNKTIIIGNSPCISYHIIIYHFLLHIDCSSYLDIEGSVWAAGASKVDVLDVLVLDEDGRLIHEDEAPLQRIHETRGSLNEIILKKY